VNATVEPERRYVVTFQQLATALHEAGLNCQWNDREMCGHYPSSSKTRHEEHAAAIVAALGDPIADDLGTLAALIAEDWNARPCAACGAPRDLDPRAAAR
jgi:hypothetical protein